MVVAKNVRNGSTLVLIEAVFVSRLRFTTASLPPLLLSTVIVKINGFLEFLPFLARQNEFRISAFIPPALHNSNFGDYHHVVVFQLAAGSPPCWENNNCHVFFQFESLQIHGRNYQQAHMVANLWPSEKKGLTQPATQPRAGGITVFSITVYQRNCSTVCVSDIVFCHLFFLFFLKQYYFFIIIATINKIQ